MAALSNSLLLTNYSTVHFSSGTQLKSGDHFLGNIGVTSRSRAGKLQFSASKRVFTVQAGYSDGGRSGSSGTFVGGFILGGIIVGALGCVYAPQISRALAGTDKKDLMRKLPKFIYDEEKALERTRKILAEKIEQLNSAIDNVSSQLHSEDAPNGVPVNSDEFESAV